MTIKTQFDIGDHAYAAHGDEPQKVTIASIRIESDLAGTTEHYMALETGWPSGIQFTLGTDIFPDEEGAMLAIEANIA